MRDRKLQIKIKEISTEEESQKKRRKDEKRNRKDGRKKKRTAKKKLREFFLQHVSWLGILHLSTLF